MARPDVQAKMRTGRACATCGTIFLGYGAQKYCQSRCRPSHYILKVYGLTAEEMTALLARADGRCEICGRPFSGRAEPAIDHNHETGEVRGLLCTNCNLGIGLFKDDPLLLSFAVAYLTPSGPPDLRQPE